MARVSLLKVRIADKWLVMIAITLGMFMSLMDHTIVNVAIPQMQRAFGADIQAIQWVVTIYMLTQAANDLNLTVVLEAEHAQRLIRQLHALLFEGHHRMAFLGECWEVFA